MKWPKSEEFSGTVNCSHLGIELTPLKIAYVEPDLPSAERTALRRAAPLLEKKPQFTRSPFDLNKDWPRPQGLIFGGSTNSILENAIF